MSDPKLLPQRSRYSLFVGGFIATTLIGLDAHLVDRLISNVPLQTCAALPFISIIAIYGPRSILGFAVKADRWFNPIGKNTKQLMNDTWRTHGRKATFWLLTTGATTGFIVWTASMTLGYAIAPHSWFFSLV